MGEVQEIVSCWCLAQRGRTMCFNVPCFKKNKKKEKYFQLKRRNWTTVEVKQIGRVYFFFYKSWSQLMISRSENQVGVWCSKLWKAGLCDLFGTGVGFASARRHSAQRWTQTSGSDASGCGGSFCGSVLGVEVRWGLLPWVEWFSLKPLLMQ